jgi:hypothetical protein
MITALKLLKTAAAKGWTFEVDQGDDDGPVATKSGPKAWTLVKEVDEAWVEFFNATGESLGSAHLMAPSKITCSPEESLVNYTCSERNEFETLCDAMIEEAIA